MLENKDIKGDKKIMANINPFIAPKKPPVNLFRIDLYLFFAFSFCLNLNSHIKPKKT